MLDKIKQLRKLKKQMEAITVEEELNGVRVKMDGSMQIKELEITNKEDKKLEKNVRKAVNKTLKKVQQQMARDMMGTGGGIL